MLRKGTKGKGQITDHRRTEQWAKENSRLLHKYLVIDTDWNMWTTSLGGEFYDYFT
jgi:hypothetical protein